MVSGWSGSVAGMEANTSPCNESQAISFAAIEVTFTVGENCRGFCVQHGFVPGMVPTMDPVPPEATNGPQRTARRPLTSTIASPSTPQRTVRRGTPGPPPVGPVDQTVIVSRGALVVWSYDVMSSRSVEVF